MKDYDKIRTKINIAINSAELTSVYCRKQQFFYGLIFLNKIIKNLMDVMDDMVEIIEDNGDYFENGVKVSINEILFDLQEIKNAEKRKDYVLMTDYVEALLLPFLCKVQEFVLLKLEKPVFDIKRFEDNIRALVEFDKNSVYALFGDDICETVLQGKSFDETQEEMITNRINMLEKNGICAEYTSSGDITLKYTDVASNNEYYLHSNNNLIKENYILVNDWLMQKKEKYLFYGMGLLHPYIYMLSQDDNVNITVVESNEIIIEMAMYYSDFAKIAANENFKFVVTTELDKLNKEISKHKDAFYVHYPSLMVIQNEQLKQRLEKYFVSESSIRTQFAALESNFKSNIKLEFGELSEISDVFIKKDVYIIAGGPSLEINIKMLKELNKNALIISTGTVLKKLLAESIIPDYCIITDSGAGTYKQISGLTKKEVGNIPLLFLSTAYHKVVRDYPSEKKYMIYQKEFTLAEEMADNKMEIAVDTGGSVSTTAMSLAIKLLAGRIFFLGLDLAYTNGHTHVSGIESDIIINNNSEEDNLQINSDERVMVDGYNGEKIETAFNLSIYLKWFENNIALLRKNTVLTPIYDATEGGAVKNGMIPITMSEAVKMTNSKENIEMISEEGTKKLSIIIPCYNVEKYIDRCLKSLIYQTIGYKNLEIICIDDASTDGTRGCLEKWQKRFPDNIINYFCKENGKQGTARNIGMDISTTDYVSFVDADDWVEEKMYEALYTTEEKYDVEIVACGSGRDEGNGVFCDIVEYKGKVNEPVYIKDEKDRHKFFEVGLGGGVWAKLYKKNIFEKYDIRFPEKLTYEDNYFGPLVGYFVESFYVLPDIYYHYFYNFNSTVARENDYGQFDRLKIQDMLYDELEKRNLLEEYKDSIISNYIEVYFANTLHIMFTRFNPIPVHIIRIMERKLKERYPDLINSDYYKNAYPIFKELIKYAYEGVTDEDWVNIANNYKFMTEKNSRTIQRN